MTSRAKRARATLPGVTREESEWAQSSVITPLNAEVRKAATRHGWQVVTGVQPAFAAHGICAHGAARWVRRIDESIRRGASLSGPLHPNGAGHLATAALISPVLANVVGLQAGGVAQTAGARDDEGNRVEWWWLPLPQR